MRNPQQTSFMSGNLPCRVINPDMFVANHKSLEERFDAWRAVVNKTFIPLSVEARDAFPFRAKMRTIRSGELVLSDMTAGAQIVRRKRTEIRHSSTDMLFLIRHISGDCVVHSDAGSARLLSGDFVLVDPHLPYDLEFGGNFRQHNVQVPQWWIRKQESASAGLMIGHRIPATLPVSRILGAATDQLFEASQASADSGDLSEIFLDLVLRSLTAVSHGTAVPSADERLGISRVLRYVANNFRDEEASPAGAAEAMGCSVRYVHKVCAMSGSTFGRILADARLSEAARLLRYRDPSRARISDIAFQTGFGDLSHFCRSFKARYGVSAGAYRG